MNNELNKIPHNRYFRTIGELPTSYLVSMTYEEQLLWFSNYLEKTIIPAFNSLLEAFEGLTYTDLENKPSINGVTLEGDKTSNELGIEQVQFDGLPSPTSELFGKIIQYVGPSDENFTKGYFYACVTDSESPTGYTWANISVQNGGDYDTLSNLPSINGITLIGNKTNNDLGIRTIQYNEMPTPSESLVGEIVQYIGNTDANFTKGYFYVCVENLDHTGYLWGGIDVQADVGGDYTHILNKPSINGVTLEGNKTSAELGIEVIQVSTMPIASVDNLDNIVQFIGTTDSTYTNGYFYKCVSDGASTPTYSWTNISVQASGGGGTSDYTQLSNLPSINGVTLTGNKTDSDLGLQEIIQYSTMPTASADYVGKVVQYVGLTSGGYREGCFYRGTADTSTTPTTYAWEIVNTGETIQFAIIPPARSENEGQIIQYTGATDNFYTNGYFYKCTNTSSGSTPVYDWVAINVQDGGSGEPTFVLDWSYSDADTLLVLEAIYNEFATYNHLPLSYVKNNNDYTMLSNVNKDLNWVYFTFSTIANANTQSSKTYRLSTNHTFTSLHSKNTYTKNIQDELVSGTSIKTINNTSLLGSGNIPTEVIQYNTMPTADSTTIGKIVQFTGTTDSTYTNGYFYIGTTDGQTTPTYSWEQLNVQPSSGGGSTTYVINYSTDSNQTILATLQNIYTEYVTNHKMPLVILTYNTSGTNMWYLPTITLSDTAYGLYWYMSFCTGISSSATMQQRIFTFQCNSQFTSLSQKDYADNELYILKRITGYSSSSTQVLKNVNGTLQWVTEA